MKQRLSHLAVICGAALSVMAMSWSQARADLIVSSQSGTSYRNGQTLPDNTVLKVPAGASLRITKTPAGTTHTISGPYSGPLSKYQRKPKCSLFARMAGKCTGKSIVGGGTRGIAK